MSLISVILNLDTRPVCNEFQGLHKGVRSRDFLTHGIANKRKFFDGFDIEVVAFVDEHEPLTHEQYDTMHSMVDRLVIHKHTKRYRGADPFHKFNDISYIQALSLARGEFIAHFDQDMAAFTRDKHSIEWMINQLDTGTNFVCYPSPNSPAPCHAPQYEGQFWASTRFFLCKREMIDITVLERAIREPEWFYETYGRPPRINPWTEQFLGVLGQYKVFYPQVLLHQWAVFPWQTYKDGTLEKLNAMPYEEVQAALSRAGGEGIFHDGADSRLMGI